MAPNNAPEIDPLTDLTADLASLEHLETGFAGVMGRLQPLVPFYDAELWMADSERQRAVLVDLDMAKLVFLELGHAASLPYGATAQQLPALNALLAERFADSQGQERRNLMRISS